MKNESPDVPNRVDSKRPPGTRGVRRRLLTLEREVYSASALEVRRPARQRVPVARSTPGSSRLGAPCAAAVLAFDLPVGANCYASGPGLDTSAPPHSDRQEVFVVQCSGKKRWVVYEPPAYDLDPERDPFSRGKGDDALETDGLRVVFDGVLGAGDLLYVPAGFPHETTTTGERAPSLHVTFGVMCCVELNWFDDTSTLRGSSNAVQGDKVCLTLENSTREDREDPPSLLGTELVPPSLLGGPTSSPRHTLGVPRGVARLTR